MAQRKTTVGEKRDVRKKQQAQTRKPPKTASPIDKLISDINTKLGSGGHIYLGSEIEDNFKERRSSGIPTLDFISCGGYPRGGLVELGGEYSCGKSVLCLHTCAHAQQAEPDKYIGWVALEPFAKNWARKNGLWIPFHPEKDPVDGASPLEVERMEQMGIEDPYGTNGLAEVVLVEDERGDVALDATIDMLRSNLFSVIVVDSIGVAKNTAWVEEQEVQDASDFPREPRMLNAYSARALLALNRRYDDNNQPAKDGEHKLETTLIHINQIGTVIGTQARAPWKKYAMKGGKGVEHNHHLIIFLWKGQNISVKVGAEYETFGQEIRAIAIKSKIGTPFLEGEVDFYFKDYDQFKAGDIDIAKDALTIGLRAGLAERSGAWFEIPDVGRWQGREQAEDFLREETEIRDWLVSEAIGILKERN